MHRLGAKDHPVNNYGGAEPPIVMIDPSEEDTTPPLSKRSSNEFTPTHRMHDTPRDPHVCSFQDCYHSQRNAFGDEEDASDNMKGAYVPSPSAFMYDETHCSVSNNNIGTKGFDFCGTYHRPQHTITPKPRYHPKPATIPKVIIPEQPKEAIKEHNEKITVDVDFLHKLESKISDLQSRVEECEGASGSFTSSSICDSRDSEDSVSDLGHKGGQTARHLQDFDDDDIIIYEP